MPELSTEQNIVHIDETLVLEYGLSQKGKSEAEKVFKERIAGALGTKSRQLDDFFHSWKHG